MGNRWGGRTMTRRVGRRAVVGTGNPMRTGRYSIWALAAACCACAIVCFSCSPGGGRDSIGVSSFHHDGNTWRFEVAILGRRVSGERSGQVLFAVFYHSSLTMREYGVDLDTRQSWVKLKGSSERPLRIVARPGQHFWVKPKVWSRSFPKDCHRRCIGFSVRRACRPTFLMTRAPSTMRRQFSSVRMHTMRQATPPVGQPRVRNSHVQYAVNRLRFSAGDRLA